MYAFLTKISDKTIAFWASLYYSSSVTFLAYAGSLANQPIDDFFRFLTLFLSILAIQKRSDSKKYKLYNALTWVSYFILASSSYDSTLFVFVWLVGLNIFTFRKLLWKKWLFFASAPAIAFGVQMLQNWWYLGDWKDVYLDMIGAVSGRVQTGNILSHFKSALVPISLMSDLKIPLAVILMGVLLVSVFKFREKLFNQFERVRFSLFLFFVAGVAYSFVFVGSGGFSYQGRQVAPFLGLLISASMCLFWRSRKFQQTTWRLAMNIILILTICIFWVSQLSRTAKYVSEWSISKVDNNKIEFLQSLKDISGGRDSVVFRLDKFSQFKYPQVHPIIEYYSYYPILSFTDISDLVRDYEWLKSRSEFDFYPIILVNNSEEVEKIRKIVNIKDITILISPSLEINL
jgi:hypothetical protein